MPNVTLAVRIRPFTERELKSEKDSCRVVNVVDDKTVTITNIKVSASGAGDSRERVRRYTADHTYDSAGPAAATQDAVFRGVGREVLECVSRGRSACVLAYGQSATGKTHTMLGTEAQPGLLPRLARALAAAHAPHTALTVSFLEIYNERVHDLLGGEEAPADCSSLPRRRGNARKDLRVREHPGKGPYVQNLRRVLVPDAAALLALVGDGSRRRRTAATRRNPASSRSHALLELATPRATLLLADLAGSEKAGWEGCGGRQKEGANINKSLVALSNVISALVSVGSGRGRFVPYRDSALTWLLKDCFTGGARTFIIATLSPSACCYGESASTLRWAARARQLPAPRPPSPALASRAAVRAQLTRLLEELASQYIHYIPETGQISYGENHWNLRIPKVVDEADSMYSIRAKPDGQNSESTASSVASGSSDVLNIGSNVNINKEISKEVDKLFGPALERAKSGSDIQLVPPIRNKRRQYRSQEVLVGNKTIPSKATKEPNSNAKSNLHINDEKITLTECASDKTEPQAHVPIFYDNTQRAEIVASVTDRLYSKLKKKEESTITKMEHAVDKKIMEPLSELRICTNARQRLVELSQRALRNKRRIGIPAHTQTKKQVIRVKDQGVDVQTDLQPYYIKERHTLTPHKDIGTETILLTPRCKEIAVGPLYGSMKLHDNSTTTDLKRVQYKTSSVMTDDLHKLDRCTQTIIAPPRRKKKNTKAKQICSENNNTPVININISHTYSVDSDNASEEGVTDTVNHNNVTVFPITPDLLTNHSSGEAAETTCNKNDALDLSSDSLEECENQANPKLPSNSSVDFNKNGNGDFSDECCSLPRVNVESFPPSSPKELRNMIFGHSSDAYPYNIILSPPTERETKRTVKFMGLDKSNGSLTCDPVGSWSPEPNPTNDNSDLSSSERPPSVPSRSSHSQHIRSRTSSECTDSSKADSDTFVWKRGPYPDTNRSFGSLQRTNYVPVYKPNTTRHRAAKTKLYRQFLGLDKDECATSSNKSLKHDEQEDSEHVFRKTRQFFESICHDDNLRKSREYNELERKALKSCDLIDASVNRYESFLSQQKDRTRALCAARKPTEYLRHLVDIRRKMVEDSENATSTDDSQNFF